MPRQISSGVFTTIGNTIFPRGLLLIGLPKKYWSRKAYNFWCFAKVYLIVREIKKNLKFSWKVHPDSRINVYSIIEKKIPTRASFITLTFMKIEVTYLVRGLKPWEIRNSKIKIRY